MRLVSGTRTGLILRAFAAAPGLNTLAKCRHSLKVGGRELEMPVKVEGRELELPVFGTYALRSQSAARFAYAKSARHFARSHSLKVGGRELELPVFGTYALRSQSAARFAYAKSARHFARSHI